MLKHLKRHTDPPEEVKIEEEIKEVEKKEKVDEDEAEEKHQVCVHIFLCCFCIIYYDFVNLGDRSRGATKTSKAKSRCV